MLKDSEPEFTMIQEATKLEPINVIPIRNLTFEEARAFAKNVGGELPPRELVTFEPASKEGA